jgi:5-methylcytosine-specific restriction endonuclease McrA
MNKRPQTTKSLLEYNRNNPITPERREKLRLSHLGQVAWNKGIKGKDSHSFGRKWTDGMRKKMSERVSGEKSHWWRGGVSPINERIRRTSNYKLWRKAVFERDNWTCQKTGIKGGYLHPHHIKNFSQFPELRFAIDNGITLSEKAHREFHKKYGQTGNNKEQLIKFLSE